jgi:hypothetical protein
VVEGRVTEKFLGDHEKPDASVETTETDKATHTTTPFTGGEIGEPLGRGDLLQGRDTGAQGERGESLGIRRSLQAWGEG